MFTYVSSPVVEGDAAIIQCFHFWFYIDGFLDGTKNESMTVFQQFDGPVSAGQVWSQRSATLEWSEVWGAEGEVETSGVCYRDRWRCEVLGWVTNILGGRSPYWESNREI